MCSIKEKVEYFYIFGVRSDLNKNLESELSLDFLIEYTSEDIKKKEIAQAMVENEMLPTSKKEAIEALNLTHLASALLICKVRSRCESLSLHKFKTTFLLTRKDLNNYIQSANKCEDSRKKLVEARISF